MLEQSASLPGSAERVEHALAAGHLAGLAGSLAGLQRLGGLADDALGRRGVLLQVLGRGPGSTAFCTSGRISVLPSFVFVWPSNCGSCSFTEMMAAKPSRVSSPERFGSFSFRMPLRAGVIVDGTRDGLLEAVQMRAALVGVDVVGEGHDGVRGIGAWTTAWPLPRCRRRSRPRSRWACSAFPCPRSRYFTKSTMPPMRTGTPRCGGLAVRRR